MSDDTSGTLAISATFTAEPLLPSLSFVLEQAGVPLNVRFCPYNQVFQELLSEASVLVGNSKGVNVVLIRVEDFIRDIIDADEALTIIARTVTELNSSLRSYALRAKVPTVVSLLPPSPRAQYFQSALDGANAQLTSQFSSLPGIILLSLNDIQRISDGDRFDGVSDELAHVPFTQGFYASLSLAIARKVHAALLPAHKVLVLDCDNTLWRGVVGEDGINGIAITSAFAAMQKFAIKSHSQGTLICLVSKNTERDVLDVFEQRADMLLKLDQIVAHRINWESKPKNIASLARTLNLGPESFVFMDDNPVECALMQTELPQVVTLQIPAEDQMETFLANVWAFDKIAVTNEDLRRTQMYKENAARDEFEAKASDIGDFIASLQVRVDIKAPTDAEWPRLAQLTQRTNQFNFTTKRRTEPELRQLAAEGSLVLRINVQDRFGDYGLVGLVVGRLEADRLDIDTFLLSCRVLGRGVEHTILRELGTIASDRNLTLVTLPFVPTSKNEPARAFIESVAAQFRMQADEIIVYLIPSSDTASITHRPGFDPQAVIEASRSTDRTVSQQANAAARSYRYAQFALQLINGRAVNEAIHLNTARPRTLDNDPSHATNDAERQMLALWEEILGITGLGIDDDYFALGGSSLAAARLFAEITRRFNIKLPLTTIISAPTIRALARQVGTQRTGATESLIQLKDGGPRNLFMIHDGDGETLLYTNLARRMPSDVSVVGVNPLATSGVPLAHTRIEDMASFYIDQIRGRQPRGPYLLGGMCAGGVIAYEMANQLLNQGEQVEFVLLLDAATPQAPFRPHRIAKQRLGRLSGLLTQNSAVDASFTTRAGLLLTATSKKAWNALSWEVSSRSRKWSVRARFRLLERLLKRRQSWPRAVPGLTARQIYESAEATYVPQQFVGPKIVLVRASAGESGDTPYVQIYSDETLGWGGITSQLTIADVGGGHFSMLQEPFVEHLADKVQAILKPRRLSQDINTSINEPA